jgi:large subunit ribosomal protein L1
LKEKRVKKSSKRYRALLKEIGEGKDKTYGVDDAVEKLKIFHKAKFDETVELSIHLGLDVKKLQQPVRNSMVLPNGVGKSVKVLVFASGEDVDKAKQIGADYVGGQEIVEKVKNGFLDFDSVVATPDMMRIVSPLGKILGPRGLMPNPKNGTVTKDLKNIVSELKKGRIDFKMDKDGNLQIPVGKISFDKEKLVENINAALNSVLAVRPSSIKGNYVSSASLSLTMSPSVKLECGRIFQEPSAL